MRGFDLEEIRAFHVVQSECRPRVGFLADNFDAIHFQAFHVAQEKSMRRRGAKHRWLGVVLFFFRKL